MSEATPAPASTASTSGIRYIRFAAPWRNKFATLIALIAALGCASRLAGGRGRCLE